jgi:holo-[acyl-carrier protein] synthase
MIVGIGIDVVEISRIEETIARFGDRFLRRVFTPAEIAYCQRAAHPAERFAARFAAKEAALKALGTGKRGGIRWHDVEIVPSPSGQPRIELHARAHERLRALGGRRAHVSLSHGRDLAVAQVILEG